MGVHDLWGIVGPTARPVRLEALRNKRLAVDASIWIYQFLKAVRDKNGNPMQNAHIVGFFRRICKLLFFGIKPVFVFDGGVPGLKKETIRKRKERREGQRENMEKTAHKLLAKQLQQRAEKLVVAQRAKQREDQATVTAATTKTEVPIGEMEFEQYFEDNPYLGQYGAGMQHAPVKKARDEHEAKIFRRQDDYDLPRVDEFRVDNKDTRMVTDYEYERLTKGAQEDMEDVDLDNLDPQSEEFNKLPLSTQYIALSHLRLRSRLRMGYTKDQLEELFPDSMEFSKFQIQMVQRRNYFTQRLMNVSGMDDGTGQNMSGRVAGERNREYALERTEGGYALSIGQDLQNEGLDERHAIKLDESSSEDESVQSVQSVQSVSEDDDDEDVEEWEEAANVNVSPIKLGRSGLPTTQERTHGGSAFMDPSIHKPLFELKSDSAKAQVHEDENDEVMQKIKSLYAYAEQNNKKSVPSEAEQIRRMEEADLRAAIEESKRDYNNVMSGKTDSEAPPIVLSKEVLEKTMRLPKFSESLLSNSKKAPVKSVKQQAVTKSVKFAEVDLTGEEGSKEADEKSVAPKEKSKPKPQPLPSWFDTPNSDFRSRFQEKIGVDRSGLREETEDEKAGLHSYREIEDLLSDEDNEAEVVEVKETPQVVDLSKEEESIDENGAVIPKKPATTGDDDESSAEEEEEEKDVEFEVVEEVPAVELEKPATQVEGEDEKKKSVVQKSITDVLKPPKNNTFHDDYEFSEDEEEELQENLMKEEEAYGQFVHTVSRTPGAPASSWSMDEEMKLQEQMRKQKRDSDEVSTNMIMDVQDLLSRFGIPYITAPMEAEAQCAELELLGLVDGIITDDSDCFLFGGAKIYKNMFNEKNYVECYQLEDIDRDMGLSRRQLIEIAIMLGSDYTEGLKGVGKVTAVEILAEFHDLDSFRDWWMQYQQGNIDAKSDDEVRRKLRKQLGKNLYLDGSFPDRKIYEAYEHPEVDHDKTPFDWGYPDLDKLRTFMMFNVGWPQSKVDEILLPIIRDLNKPQKTIEEFFPVELVRKRREMMMGKRMKAATKRLKH